MRFKRSAGVVESCELFRTSALWRLVGPRCGAESCDTLDSKHLSSLYRRDCGSARLASQATQPKRRIQACLSGMFEFHLESPLGIPRPNAIIDIDLAFLLIPIGSASKEMPS